MSQPLAALDHQLAELHKVPDLVSGPDVGVFKLHPLHIVVQAVSEEGLIAIAPVPSPYLDAVNFLGAL